MPEDSARKRRDRFWLWIAEGFGSGRTRFAPGTFGSLVGVLWFLLLLCTSQVWLFLILACAAVALSVWCCGAAERILQREDPGSVVLDEIVAVPLCFVSLLLSERVRSGGELSSGFFLGPDGWFLTLAGFGLFRLFDVWKPWPVGVSQRLPGGWGVTADDLLAAIYVNLCFLLWIVYAGPAT